MRPITRCPPALPEATRRRRRVVVVDHHLRMRDALAAVHRGSEVDPARDRHDMSLLMATIERDSSGFRPPGVRGNDSPSAVTVPRGPHDTGRARPKPTRVFSWTAPDSQRHHPRSRAPARRAAPSRPRRRALTRDARGNCAPRDLGGGNPAERLDSASRTARRHRPAPSCASDVAVPASPRAELSVGPCASRTQGFHRSRLGIARDAKGIRVAEELAREESFDTRRAPGRRFSRTPSPADVLRARPRRRRARAASAPGPSQTAVASAQNRDVGARVALERGRVGRVARNLLEPEGTMRRTGRAAHRRRGVNRKLLQ